MANTLKSLLISFVFFSIGLIPVLSQTSKFTFQRPKMGSPFIITVYADDSLAVLPIIEKAYLRVDILNQIFSDYLESSEINTVCHKTQIWQLISDDLHHLLTISQKSEQNELWCF